MSEQNIINLLNNINIHNILVLIKTPISIKDAIGEYIFQAMDNNKTLINGKIDILNNEINISYSEKNNTAEKHLFSNIIHYYIPSYYSVYSKHILVTKKEDSIEEKLIAEQTKYNTKKEDFFKFEDNITENKEKQKILVKIN